MDAVDPHNLTPDDTDRIPLILRMRDYINNVPNQINQIAAQLDHLNMVRGQLLLTLRNLANEVPVNFDLLKQISISLSAVCAAIARMQLHHNDMMIHGAERVEAYYQCHIVGSRILEVNDFQTLNIALWLHNACGWNGCIAIDHALEPAVVQQILKNIGDLPHHFFVRNGGNLVFD